MFTIYDFTWDDDNPDGELAVRAEDGRVIEAMVLEVEAPSSWSRSRIERATRAMAKEAYMNGGELPGEPGEDEWLIEFVGYAMEGELPPRAITIRGADWEGF